MNNPKKIYVRLTQNIIKRKGDSEEQKGKRTVYSAVRWIKLAIIYKKKSLFNVSDVKFDVVARVIGLFI